MTWERLIIPQTKLAIPQTACSILFQLSVCSFVSSPSPFALLSLPLPASLFRCHELLKLCRIGGSFRRFLIYAPPTFGCSSRVWLGTVKAQMIMAELFRADPFFLRFCFTAYLYITKLSISRSWWA